LLGYVLPAIASQGLVIRKSTEILLPSLPYCLCTKIQPHRLHVF
jgi:hypothetical protein